MKKFFLQLIILLLIASNGWAQSSDSTRSVDKGKVNKFLNLGLAVTSYRGDLMESFSKAGAAFHMGIKFNKGRRMNGEFEFMAGFFNGQNSAYDFSADPSATPNTFFSTNFVNFNYHLNVNLIRKKGFRLFISQGIGLMRFTPRDEDYNTLNDQLETRALTEDYSNITFNFPLQIGAQYVLPKGYGLLLRTGWANVQSDYIDNISNWGTRDKKDNIFTFRISFMVPLSYF